MTSKPAPGRININFEGLPIGQIGGISLSLDITGQVSPLGGVTFPQWGGVLEFSWPLGGETSLPPAPPPSGPIPPDPVTNGGDDDDDDDEHDDDDDENDDDDDEEEDVAGTVPVPAPGTYEVTPAKTQLPGAPAGVYLGGSFTIEVAANGETTFSNWALTLNFAWPGGGTTNIPVPQRPA
jgi:hypothetical protein